MRIFLAALGAVLVVLGHGFVAASAATVSLNQEMAAPIEESGDAVAAQCWQGNCSYRDPVDAGCNGGAVTPRELTLNDIRIEYRYSSSCDASWSRMTILTPNIGCAAGSVCMKSDTTTGRSSRLRIRAHGVRCWERAMAPRRVLVDSVPRSRPVPSGGLRGRFRLSAALEWRRSSGLTLN